MSIQAVAWALDQDLPARPKLVLVSIANHANHVDGYCWLKADTIAAEASCSPRAVFNFVGDLIRNGYIRKAPRRSDDGRQRANDYWILFNRQPLEWTNAAKVEVDEERDAESDEPHTEPTGESQDIVEPHARGAVGENTDPLGGLSDQTAHRAVGPHAPACSHKDSAEPSKTNPLKAALPPRPPRGYRPPPAAPPPPLGATTLEGTGKLIFVFWPSKAYDAWQRRKERETGRPWNCRTTREGRWGWYFPTLFPPEEKPPPDGTALATDEDLDQFAKTG